MRLEAMTGERRISILCFHNFLYLLYFLYTRRS